MRCKGSSTPYDRPQVAGLQKFAKFSAGEGVTPRGNSTQQTVILTICRGGGSEQKSTPAACYPL